uniref:transposase n=1 Tax=Amycolatopsis ponsaeliensis TaxID=2992142 RepID=UPI00255151AA
TVGAIITRVSADIDARVDRLAGLRRIGIDEISFRRGQNYLTAVVDHDTRRLVWLGEGRTKATLEAFFDQLGHERA